MVLGILNGNFGQHELFFMNEHAIVLDYDNDQTSLIVTGH